VPTVERDVFTRRPWSMAIAGRITTTDVLAVRFSQLEGTDSPSSSAS
jgi:hypothetical protein